jgi:hypothetical protein
MPNSQLVRLDKQALNRRQAGGLFERREIEPDATHIKRRTGTLRTTNASPSLLGLTYGGNASSVVVDYDFTTAIAATSAWTIFFTADCPATDTEDTLYAQILSFGGVRVYLKYTGSNKRVFLQVYDAAGTLLANKGSAVLGTSKGNTLQFVVGRTATGLKLNFWYYATSPAIAADTTAAHTFAAQSDLSFFGENIAALTPEYTGVILNNVLIYDADVFSLSDYPDFVNDTTPDTSITSPGVANLLWHETFASGGNILTYTDGSATTLFSYLRPSAPAIYPDDAPETTHFGGGGTIEVPFYLDFDEYYWTATNAAARVEWCFQLKLTLPEVLAESCIFELQDLAKVSVVASGPDFIFRFDANNGDSYVESTEVLAGGTDYDVFVARDATTLYIKVGTTEDTANSSNPIIYLYDKTLGFTIGDCVDLEATQPFFGKLERFALHNTSTRGFGARADAVIYYDIDSIQGDEVIDRGNRSLNAYLGIRSSTKSPLYQEGGFPGGSYVAATGGYLLSNAGPGSSYTGDLLKPITKDVVIQRRGQRAFMTSNGVSYVVDDLLDTYRPLGVPRPSTKVTCYPQGVGPIDGFVRYAYRYVTQDGTVGPVFDLDPCDATGGVNVYLGANQFTTPADPAFGLSFGECDAGKLTASDEVQCFIAHDKDAGDAQLLHKEISFPGLTFETAFRLPNLTAQEDESVISQGVHAPYGPECWAALNAPKEFPWFEGQNHESCIQFTFRYVSGADYQVLFSIGKGKQRYETGAFGNTHWHLHTLVVSIQPPESLTNDASIVVCVADPASGHRDNSYKQWAHDYNFQDGHDYTIFVSRAGSLYGSQPGADLTTAIFNHTLHDTDDGLGGTYDGWKLWPDEPSDTALILRSNFFGPTYSGNGYEEIMWGTCRTENDWAGKTRRRLAAGSTTFEFWHIKPFYNGTQADNTGGQRLYHARMWREDKPLTLLAVRALKRFGARSGPLADKLDVDVAFCSDSSQSKLEGGWDYPNDVRVKYYALSPVEVNTVFNTSVEQTVLFAYGYDASVLPGTPDTHATTSTDTIPLWVSYTNRNEGALVVGVGRNVGVEIGTRRWHASANIQTFDEFASTLDLSQWTWITLYFHHIARPTLADTLDVWLERVFIDGNTGEWGDVFDADTGLNGPNGKSQNTAATAGQYALYSLGGVPGIDTAYEVEIAEARLWAGERYAAQGGGSGQNAFGTYMSTRIPPNKWEEMWHYLRFAPLDVDDMDAQTAMDQVGAYAEEGGNPQASSDAVDIYQSAEVLDGVDTGGSGGAKYFVPFPTPPLSSIRGIQIFRTQVVPVQETYPNGEPNPNALTDAFKACRAAPLYYLSEIPDGTGSYFDSAVDTLLGPQLDLTEGRIPGKPGGVFEWAGYLGMWVTNLPRLHFSASPNSWESFPADMVYDLPLKEQGVVQAAGELASRDSRSSRLLVLGKAWGAFLEGNPTSPRMNSLGAGVGAASSRCLVIERGVAYAYNGTLWAITGDGAIQDIGLPVLDLLPPPESTRLSVSSTLSSLYVINELTGLTLRFHLALQEWYVEDRYALSTTDIDGEDYWVHLSGYPSKGNANVFADDVESDTAAAYIVSGYDNAADQITLADVTGIKLGQRLTVAANEDARVRQTVTVESINGTTLTVAEDLALAVSGDTPTGNPGEVTSVTYTYKAYCGIGYWGAMLDTGEFRNPGVLQHVELGHTAGDGWHAMSYGADFAGDPADRERFDAVASFPTALRDAVGGGGIAARWGLIERQRIQRLIFWSYEASSVGLSELELSFSND